MPEPAPAPILIVDDDPGLLRLLGKTLAREGHAAAVAHSGGEAISWLARNTARLMLMDLKLPDVDGKELLQQIARIGRSVPFITITGQGDERAAVEMMKRGALDYVVKDARFLEVLPSVVGRALEQIETRERLAAAQAALEESQKQLLVVSEREQRRLGAELHDGLGQQLTAIEMRCQSLRQDLPAGRPDLKKEASEICQYLRDAIAQTRLLARGLAPLSLDSRGLVEALAGLATRASQKNGIQCVLESAASVRVDDDLAAVHLFRIAQEAVNNAVKHSGASRVVIRLEGRDGSARLEVCDDGLGLRAAPHPGGGLGLQIMRHRAGAIGAELSVNSGGSGGVAVVCVLPARKQ